jgi:O-antigen ligase
MKMKSNGIESYPLWIIVTLAVLIAVAMPVHAFVSTWLGTAIGPLLVWKSWKEILLVALVPIVAWYCVLRPDVARALWQRKVNQLIALYVLLHLLLSFSSTASPQAVVAGLMMNLRFLAIFVLAQVIAQANPPQLRRLRELVPRWLLWVAVGLGVLAVLQVYVLPRDFLTHFGYSNSTIAPYILVDENPNALRAFATMRGPNTLGMFLLMPLAVAVGALYRRRKDWLAWSALGLTIVAIYLTGSRSAWLGAFITLAVAVAMVVPWQRMVKWTKLAIAPLLIAMLVVGWAAVSIPAVRLAIFHSSPGDSSLSEGSTDKHWESTLSGIEDAVRHPWGSGPGSAGPASFYNATGTNLSENYYVQIAQEVGWIGLGLFVAICFYAIRYIVRRRTDPLAIALIASFAGVAFINLLLHGWADDPTALVWWALAGLVVGSYNKHDILK